MGRQVAKLAGALSVLTRHSSSRKTMSMTQCKEFSNRVEAIRKKSKAAAPG
jgi:hypothetical protein